MAKDVVMDKIKADMKGNVNVKSGEMIITITCMDLYLENRETILQHFLLRMPVVLLY